MSRDDERLRKILRDAHRDDAPPPFGKLWKARARGTRVPLVLAPLAALSLALVIVLARSRPQPIAAERLRIEWNDPLAFLLEPPSSDLLTTVPRFEPHFAPQGELQ